MYVKGLLSGQRFLDFKSINVFQRDVKTKSS